MFVGDGGSGGGASLSTGDLAGWRGQLTGLDRDVTDAERVEQIRVLEELKAAAAAAQARISVGLDASQRAAQAARGVPAARQGTGVAAQIGLARRESPHKGARYLGLAKILVAEMPHTLAALTAGRINEWRTTLLARETGCLSAEHRAQVDEALAGPAGIEQTERWGDARLVAEARKLAYRLDPQAFVKRQAKAEADRTVSLRPAPDTMAYLTGLLPVAQAVACHAALRRAADSARAAGDERSRGQVMAIAPSARCGADSSVLLVRCPRSGLHGPAEAMCRRPRPYAPLVLRTHPTPRPPNNEATPAPSRRPRLARDRAAADGSCGRTPRGYGHCLRRVPACGR